MDFSGNVFLRYGFGFKLFVFNWFASSLLILFFFGLSGNWVLVPLGAGIFVVSLVIDVEKVWLDIISWRKKND